MLSLAKNDSIWLVSVSYHITVGGGLGGGVGVVVGGSGNGGC